jgi:hypothetical protein
VTDIDPLGSLAVKIVSLVASKVDGRLTAYDGIEAAREVRALLATSAAPQGAWQLVPIAALKWLFGEAPDQNGKWFGECEPKDTTGKRYWWRSKFRAMLDAQLPVGDVVEALDLLVKAVTVEVNEKGAGGYLLARLSDARNTLSRLRADDGRSK